MAGYYPCSKSYSMSKNAQIAYNKGYMPLSKWTKKAILEIIEDDYLCDDNLEVILNFAKKHTLKELKEKYLRYMEWHHTGKYYNSTDFYKFYMNNLEEDALEEEKERRALYGKN